ncbi:hypothetical protein PENTCL1PPCAC_24998, partial [Pristionchus entomophagus]
SNCREQFIGKRRILLLWKINCSLQQQLADCRAADYASYETQFFYAPESFDSQHLDMSAQSVR